MYKLNLPQYEYNVKKADGKVWIFDVIRKKYIVLTPEEWVRQHFVHYLIQHLHYPKSLIKVEGGLSYNQLKKRSDIVVFDREGQPWMVVECKSPEIKITAASSHQASVYNASLKAKYITVSNGLVHFCSLVDWQQGKTELLTTIPSYGS
ncbi:type I restriction enzyme HsdR N-terminal domain-containing protein [Chryseosolibacter indicus]|uniref:Type I restriction enzyme HsdR N-terminal domain-containing protein n=1 Tax=Chryseosolibacter indicus TaxID=2782351 RepID=A0ABS5VRS8_9BACT|nr:type I restriction enzyme HsdR N-terminal domain-containing protein [Chryseosolibacter indicus]MBT1703492.1 type I restriction enzyme HsdR N-terminal domain-containing protein [Chryseosolibacter indicus]